MRALKQIMAVALIGMIGYQVQAQSAQEHLSKGQQKSQTAQYAEAVRHFDAALGQNPHYEEAYYYRGEAHYRLGMYQKALNDFGQAIQIDPSQAITYHSRGLVYLEMLKYAEAIADFSKALQISPNNERMLADRALAYYHQGEYTQAQRDCDRALKAMPGYAFAYSIKGRIAEAQQQYPQALTHYQAAIHHNRYSPKYQTLLADLYVQMERYNEAMNHYNEALQYEPSSQHHEAYTGRAALYLRGKDYQTAMSDAAKAIQLNRRHFAAYVVRGLVHTHLGDVAKAEEDFRFYIENARTASDFHYIAGMVYRHAHDQQLYTKAVAWAKKAVELNNNARNNTLCAQLHYAVFQLPEAQKYAQKAIELARHSGEDNAVATKLLQELQSSASLDRTPPEIQIITPSMANRGFVVVEEREKIEIVGQVSDESGVSKVLVNGNIARLEANGRFRGDVVLEDYETYITLRATDKRGNTSEQTFVVRKNNGQQTASYASQTRQTNGQQAATRETIPQLGRHRALLFAVNQYDSWTQLINPVYDAHAIARNLEEIYGFEVEIVENPTREQIALTLRRYASQQYSNKDQLLVFFAGHGIYDEIYREGFLVAKDSKIRDESRSSYYSYSELRSVLSRIHCDHVLLVLDACFSGTFDQLVAMRGLDPEDRSKWDFINQKMQYRTRRYITSAGKEYVPDGRPGQHSPFARAFLEALRSEGGQDGVLTINEVMSYMSTAKPQPLTGEFDGNEPGSDFLFIAR